MDIKKMKDLSSLKSLEDQTENLDMPLENYL